jgi:hypothetical protein
LNVALQLGSLDSLSGFPRPLPLNLSTFKSKLHRNCGAEIPTSRNTPNPCLRFSVHTSKFRIPQLLCLPLLRKLPGCVPTIPILEPSAHHSSPATHHSPLHSSSFLSNSCALFCTFLRLAKIQLIYFQTLPHSLPKNTGGGGALATSIRIGEAERRRFFLAKDHSRCACQIAGGLLFGVV